MAQIPSPFRLYLTATGKVVKAGDPAAATLYVCEDGLVDEDVLKLFVEPPPTAEPEAAPEPKPKTKAVAKPPATKQITKKKTK